MWKYYYQPDGTIAIVTQSCKRIECGCEMCEPIESDQYLDPNLYQIDPITHQFVEKAQAQTPSNKSRR